MHQGPTARVDETQAGPCPVCDVVPTVLVALRHPVMRRWTEDLLATEHGCWELTEMDDNEMLADAIVRIQPDLVVVDERDFPACCQAALDRMPPERVVVIGPEPDTSYQTLALSNGAGGWVSRDHVADELSSEMRAALGCHHEPCPPSRSPAMGSTTGTSQTGGRSR